MGVTNLRIADRMHVDYRARASGSNTQGYLDGQTTQQVSMTGASNATLTLQLIGFKGNADELVAIMEESNDGSNWFEANQTTAGTGRVTITTASPNPTLDRQVGMAFVRVLFLIQRNTGSLATGDGAVVQCDISTYL